MIIAFVHIDVLISMDDCNLKKLVLAKCVLSPKFSADILEYTTQVSHTVDSVKVTATPSDVDASYNVFKGVSHTRYLLRTKMGCRRSSKF